jgi:hypothetical protein
VKERKVIRREWVWHVYRRTMSRVGGRESERKSVRENTNAANVHASASKRSKGRLSTRSRCLCAGTSSGAEFDVKGVDTQLLI